MRIREAVKRIEAISNGWVRVQQVRRVPGGLDLCLSIQKGQRGKTVDQWTIACRSIHEAKITDFDGGGLALYSSSHPAAHQYAARRAELRWPRASDHAQVLMALQRAHVEAVEDWIPFDRYLLINTPWKGVIPDFAPVSGNNFFCRRPDFLLRAYANALEAIGEGTQFTLRSDRKSKSIRPGVLHFGASYIVANTFTARRGE